ncbi:L-histidine N(alpha)-methyltransferase [Fluviispira vulneris]|uniref:L-histidine N(alpha)-methyltransferase n=1 Tax=Fluviispira vulneris TaxID=2763012 RepID=UPI0016448430|nr:L-histidine N(alpha)-methyltransferase [Fluviispira vulneris]
MNNNKNSLQESEFALDVKQGLESFPKRIPSKYFYDKEGSRLFDLITEQEEYYLTRTEKQILASCASELKPYVGKIKEILEFGPGDGSKAEIILKHFMTWNPKEISYKAIDISISAIEQSLARFRKYPNIQTSSIIGDYNSFSSPAIDNNGRFFLFLGSTIGNYDPAQVKDLLSGISQHMTKNDFLLIGFDKKKDISLLTEAYNDKANITHDFNLNLLVRMNAEIGSNFIKSNFSHHGFYNPLIGAMQSF